MELVEIRILDGPNLFLDGPAVKIELGLANDESTADAAPLLDTTVEAIAAELQTTGAESDCRWLELETPEHVAIVFRWSRRAYARCLARQVADHLTSKLENVAMVGLDTCRAELVNVTEQDDCPELINTDDHKKQLIAITGTNGKTTTTRLISHIFMTAGRSVGWSSSSGVYVNGEEVLHGDYSGPQGAAAVINSPTVEIAVLESARGGILLRGLAFDRTNVSVFTNISADHLDLQGIHSVEGLARVKAVVAHATRPDGVAVLNGDDSLVLNACNDVAASVWLTSRRSDNPVVQSHTELGGTAVVVDSGRIVVDRSGVRETIIDLPSVPVTFQGHAGFMVENALLATAAALAAGATVDEVRVGLMSFESTPDLNPGRLNVYSLDGFVVVVDFAHNEVGLEVLIDFADSISTGGRVISVIGTAGDRTDDAIRALGSIAAARSDYVISKGTYKYLRGRELDDLMRLYREGVDASKPVPFEESNDEITGLSRALEVATDRDIVVVMAQEFLSELHDLLMDRGAVAYQPETLPSSSGN